MGEYIHIRPAICTGSDCMTVAKKKGSKSVHIGLHAGRSGIGKGQPKAFLTSYQYHKHTVIISAVHHNVVLYFELQVLSSSTWLQYEVR